MDNPKICNCPFTDWCHEPRQRLQEMFRSGKQTYKVEDCDFYKMIDEHERENE